MSNTSVGKVAASTRGVVVRGSHDSVISGISIDTRTLNPGDLFFAIRGPNNDGHKFIPQALEKGAVGTVVDSRYQAPEIFPKDRVLLIVDDTHQALKDLAAVLRKDWRGSLVGVTGSMGKTTTKEFAAHILETEYSVYRSPGNLNNLFGLPLAIFGLSPEDHIGIFEMGMSAPGEIAEMCRIAEPVVGIITNVAPVHLAFFSSIEEIAKAKGELAESLPNDGLLIYNADDPLVRGIAANFPGAKTGFGLSESAQVRADQVEIAGVQETRFRLLCDGIEQKAMIPLPGTHYVMNALPGIALGRQYGINLGQMVESLRYLRQAPMRGQIVNFADGFSVVDDSYNSNPKALMQMIDTFAKVSPGSRRILVAGEMLELGAASEQLHFECGVFAAQAGIDIVVGVQGAARELARGAVSAGLPEDQVHFFTEINPAVDFVSRTVQAGDLVLIKGSRGVHLDRMVRTLRMHHSEVV